MNNNKNKAYLWEKCITLGIFENIHKDMAPRIQSTFENVIEGFANRKENIDILNQECIIKIKEEIDYYSSNMGGTDIYEPLKFITEKYLIDFSFIHKNPYLEEINYQEN